jgi:hypothetical protein
MKVISVLLSVERGVVAPRAGSAASTAGAAAAKEPASRKTTRRRRGRWREGISVVSFMSERSVVLSRAVFVGTVSVEPP